MNSVACERAVRDFERMESSELYEVLMERLSCYVPMRTVQILERRFCREETVREVGAAFGVSGSRIQQIEARGLERARKEFNKMFREEPAGGWVEKERKDGVTELKPARREETMAPSFGSWGWLPGKGLVLLAPAEAVVAPC
jgi:hypothetical protein